MRFSRFVFIAAGVWGVVVLAPLFFLFDISGRQYAASTSYPQFFYGFVITALVFYVRGRISNVDVSAAWPDLILGCLFIVAFFKARR